MRRATGAHSVQGAFNGTMLVTVERNGVLSHRYLRVQDNAASLELPVEEAFLPNVYVSPFSSGN